MSDTIITTVHAREILDSRGNPTIEVDLELANGIRSRAAVPSGASTGEQEAVELRDGDPARYSGKGVLRAVENVNTTLAETVVGLDATDQETLDRTMIERDGTPNKAQLGANAILSISMAAARAGALSQGRELYQYLCRNQACTLPVPMMNVLNGGSHADNNVDIQEFMIFPLGAASFREALRMGAETFHSLKKVLKKKGHNTSVGDEGGFAPNLRSNQEAIENILEGIVKAGYTPGRDIYIALDPAASAFFHDGKYHLESEGRVLDSDEMVYYYQSLVEQFPIVSIEDGLDENDWDGWVTLNQTLGKRIQVVGDDITVTNIRLFQKAIERNIMNAILIKLNQIGTVTETIQAVELARKNDFGAVISHRSGETEDTIIADFAVAMGMGQIKTGSLSRTDRICKYNQLLRIEEQLSDHAHFPGLEVLGRS